MLEDNLRTPSGVSYMLENRRMMMRLFPELFQSYNVRAGRALSADCCSRHCARARREGSASRRWSCLRRDSTTAPYFEHAFLAQQMGVELVEAVDSSSAGRQRLHAHDERAPAVDVIYRRIDDVSSTRSRSSGFGAGRAGSARRVPAGNVDPRKRNRHRRGGRQGDYPYVPEMIRFYLVEKSRCCGTWPLACASPTDRATCSSTWPELVVKEVQGSGGYGMLIGPAASKAELDAFRRPHTGRTLSITSRSPRYRFPRARRSSAAGIAPRHIDLRPFVLERT